MDKKYVMTGHGIIVFPGTFAHADFRHFEPTSAGFIYFRNKEGSQEIEAVCYGESESLKLKSHQDDSRKATVQLCQ